MAKKSMIAKFQRGSKFPVRNRNRCLQCGRARSYIRHLVYVVFVLEKMQILGLSQVLKK